MDLVKVMVIGTTRQANDFWQRWVGGVLKDMATVTKGYIEDIQENKPELIVFYNNFVTEREIHKAVCGKDIRIIGLNLVLMPKGVKTLYRIGKEKNIGVVMHHLHCANILLSEILNSGYYKNHFTSGTFSEIDEMNVDLFVVGEESMELMGENNRDRQVIPLPRCLSPYSAAILVNTVSELLALRYV